jgi:DNA-binding MarR family transcriptional regulator
MPLAVLDHLPRLHGAEFKVLLALGRHQARSGGRDQKPFPYSIPQIQEDTGLCPRAISKAISRLDKQHLILRVKKCGALPNRYRVLLESAAPQKITVAKKLARASKRPKPTPAVEVKVPAPAAPPQKRRVGRRRKDSPPLPHVERPNLFRDAGIDPNQPS